MKKNVLFLTLFFFAAVSFGQKDSTIKKKDRKRDVLMQQVWEILSFGYPTPLPYTGIIF